ncbi:MAG: hypothetical protein J7L34_09300 [Thermotogaceae bacterium]|nr:hypothetical protein [Thermotogaceae bacterium]
MGEKKEKERKKEKKKIEIEADLKKHIILLSNEVKFIQMELNTLLNELLELIKLEIKNGGKK